MASRGFDGKVALLLGEGRWLLSTYVAPPRGHSSPRNEESRGRGERRKGNGRCGRGRGVSKLAEASRERYYISQESLGLEAGATKS